MRLKDHSSIKFKYDGIMNIMASFLDMMASFSNMMGFWPEMMVLQLPSVGCHQTGVLRAYSYASV